MLTGMLTATLTATGVDDALALLLALRSKELHVVGTSSLAVRHMIELIS